MAMEPPAAAASVPPDEHGLGFNLAVIALVVVMAGVGLAYVLEATLRPAGLQAQGLKTATLAGTQLQIPTAWLRDGVASGEGFAHEVDLAVSLPLGPRGALRRVEITLLPRSRVRASVSLLDGVYLHQFMPEQVSGPPGLIGKPLMAQDGFAEETVWYDPLSPKPFVAKCMAPIVAGASGHCLRTVYLGPHIAAVYGFDDDVLGNWGRFDDVMKTPLARIGAL